MLELKNNPAGNFFLLAGPCVIEGEEMACSYRKENRSRLDSFTGIGDE